MADAPHDLGAEIDRLYQQPAEAFIEARTGLAARLKASGDKAGAQRAKALPRPTVVAWAVNQIYWRARVAFEGLLDAGERLRAVQGGGAPAEALREAMRERREALAAALERASRFLKDAGHAATPAVEQRLSNTLLALATYGRQAHEGIAHGRLTHDLEPPGFDAWDGAAMMEAARAPRPTSSSAPAAPAAADPKPGPEPAPEATAGDSSQRAIDDEAARRRVAEQQRLQAEVERGAADVARLRIEHDETARAVRTAEAETATVAAQVDAARRRLEELTAQAGQADAAAASARAREAEARAALEAAEARLSATRAALAATRSEGLPSSTR